MQSIISRAISQDGTGRRTSARRLALCSLVAVAAVAGTVAVSAAGPPGDGDAAGAAAAPVPNPPTASEKHATRVAEEVLTSRCMAALGFTYVPPDLPAPRENVARPGTYGSDDVAFAAAHGFGWAEQRADQAAQEKAQAEARAADPNAQVLKGLSPARRTAWQAALSGTGREIVRSEASGVGEVFTNADGCTSAARRELYGDLATWGRVRTLAVNLPALVHPKVVADPRYVAGLGQWRTCMERRGFPYGSPAEAAAAAADGHERQPGDAARAAETRIAVAAATCARDTRLVAVAEEAERDHLAEVRATHRADLDTYARLSAIAYRKSLTVR